MKSGGNGSTGISPTNLNWKEDLLSKTSLDRCYRSPDLVEEERVDYDEWLKSKMLVCGKAVG